jgi:hypothetical protein
MGDVKLSANQTAQVLKKLEESARSVLDVRAAIIDAMAERHRESAPPSRPASGSKKKKKR